MDEETQRSMRLAMIAVAASFGISLVSYILMAANPVGTYADYDKFIRIVIVSTVIQFVVLPVLLTFFVNDSGELENFTKKGPMETAWLVNAIGVLVLIIAGALLGYAFSLFYFGWNPPSDPGSVLGTGLIIMTWSMFLQSLGFCVPVFYFMISKRLAKGVIPFKKNELLSDFIGLAFSVLLPIPAVILVISPVYGTVSASIFGIVASGIGIAWMVLYIIALKDRKLPDIPED
nr:hypothetical protein [Candidatus Sigynarchaeota archaeon]